MICLVVQIAGGVVGCIFSHGVEGGTGGGEAWCSSDEVLLSAVVTCVLEGGVVLQGCVCTLSKLCALGLIGVVRPLVSVHVA